MWCLELTILLKEWSFEENDSVCIKEHVPHILISHSAHSVIANVSLSHKLQNLSGRVELCVRDWLHVVRARVSLIVSLSVSLSVLSIKLSVNKKSNLLKCWV